MRLKSLELIGFKSFADRVSLDISKGVSGFVGPNGCGKSNLVDAIRWVLGEQRVSALRGDSMGDVIFKGNASGRRTPMNFAEVSLTFINENGDLDLDYEEVVVTRRLFRTGESEYLLNRSSVRLKDIRTLFMNTGVGIDGYSFMEQGRIDSILEANPRARRTIFEEAAGITLYKTQRREAERRLERTGANLLRLGDLIDELEKRIRSLKNQAGRARSYLSLTERIRELKRDHLIALHVDLRTTMEELEGRRTAASSEEQEHRDRLESMQLACGTLDENMVLLREGLFAGKSRLAELRTALEESGGKVNMLDRRFAEIAREREENERRRNLLFTECAAYEGTCAEIARSLEGMIDGEESLKREVADTGELVLSAGEELKNGQERKRTLESGLYDLNHRDVEVGNKLIEAEARNRGLLGTRHRLVQKQNLIADELFHCRRKCTALWRTITERESERKGLAGDLESGRARAGELERGLSDLREAIRGLEADRVKHESRIELLAALVDRREGVGRGARSVMQEAGREGGSLGFVRGILGELLDVDMKHSRAVEAVLRDKAEAVVVSTLHEAGQVYDFLRENDLGGVTVLALSEFEGRSIDPGSSGFSLTSSVQCGEELEPLVESFLSSVVLVDRGGMLAPGSTSTRVTLDGDVYRPGVLRVGGETVEPGMISRRSELASLQLELGGIREKLESIERERESGEATIRDIDRANMTLEQELDEVELVAAGLNAEYEKYCDRMKRLSGELRLLHEECHDAEKSRDSLSTEIRDLRSVKAEISRQARSGQEDFDAASLKTESFSRNKLRLEERLKDLEIRLVEQSGKRERLEKEGEILKKNVAESRKRIAELDEDRSRLEERSEEVRLDISSLKERMEEKTAERSDLLEQVARKEEHIGSLQADLDRQREEAAREEERVEEVRKRFDAIQLEIREKEVKLETLGDQARNDLDLDLHEAASGSSVKLEEVQLAAMEEEIRIIRGKIARIGNVNLEAVSELEAVEERYSHLKEQRDDLVKAEKNLTGLINQLNKESRIRFAETFEDVRKHFGSIFRKLFRGGRADIRLQEGEDILDAGIEIIAGPPGKDIRSISLLSGGERSLTAVGLLFSLFKARPSPFCILDEVDAALDETNIERFCSLLGDFAEESQFLIVTHSKRTMANVDTIFGITMEEGGVSKLVSMKIEDYSDQVA